MINICNVSKRFKDHEVLRHINLKLPRYGLIIVKGPSGCGKTTLLNLISGLLPFEGEIEVDGHQLQLMREKEKDDFRLRNYGFVFQDFKLFENETVLNNITFPMEVTSVAQRESKERKCASLLSMVGLRRSLKQKVSSLSGGEKQRVAIARALINNPKIILADEPTGALDEKNGKDIMKIFQTISLRSLVIMVTHDDDIANEYGDEIIEMMDGEIINIIHQEKNNKEKYIPLSKMYYSNKKSEIPSSFLFNHTMTSLKQKKWRTMICNGITSLGLIGVGLASSLSSAISTNIKKSYSQLIDDSKITITMKESNNSLRGMYAASKYEAYDLLENNQDLIYDIGCTYYNDFESFFPHKNCIALADTNYYAPIEGMSARHINEFRWLDIEHPKTIYPNDIEYLQNDQVVLSLTIDMVYDICYELKIVRTVTSLSRYLLEKPLKIYFDFENRNWEYSDQQLLDVVGFTLENKAGIYHNNHMWNEYMFEEKMRFPKDDAISLGSKLPWTLKKIYYFYSNSNTEDLLKRVLYDTRFQPYVLEIADERYYPWLSVDNEQNIRKRVLIFANTRNDMPISYYDLMTDLDDNITNPIYGSLAGYSIYPSAMMYGFSSFMYFSGNLESLNETIDINTTLNPNDNENVELPNDVLCGHYSQTITGGVNFRTISSEIINGRKPNNYEEIVISTGIARNIFNDDALNQDLHIAYLYSQKVLDNGMVIKHFKTSSVKIVGVIDNEKNVIYHDSGWTLLFFQTQLGVSAFNLGINSMIIEVKDESIIPNVISKLEKGFPELDFTEPMSSINDGINQVCFYIQIALTIFSTIAIIISILLLSICDYLYILENKKDIGLVRCIGVNKKEARKFVITHSVIMSFISFVLSSIELVATSFLISLELSFQMGTSFEFSFNPLSLIYMFALAFSISLISSLAISYRINKLDPLSALKS